MDYYNLVMHNRQHWMLLTCDLLKVIEYYTWVKYNSPALDVLEMWSVNSYGLLQLGDA